MTVQARRLSYRETRGQGCTAVYRSLLYPRTKALQVTNWKLAIVITMDKFIVKCSRLEVPQQETVPPPPAAGSGSDISPPDIPPRTFTPGEKC